MRLCVAGAYGAFGLKHLDALSNIDGIEVTSVMGPTREKIDALAAEKGIGHAATDLAECIARDDVDARQMRQHAVKNHDIMSAAAGAIEPGWPIGSLFHRHACGGQNSRDRRARRLVIFHQQNGNLIRLPHDPPGLALTAKPASDKAC